MAVRNYLAPECSVSGDVEHSVALVVKTKKVRQPAKGRVSALYRSLKLQRVTKHTLGLYLLGTRGTFELNGHLSQRGHYKTVRGGSKTVVKRMHPETGFVHFTLHLLLKPAACVRLPVLAVLHCADYKVAVLNGRAASFGREQRLEVFAVPAMSADGGHLAGTDKAATLCAGSPELVRVLTQRAVLLLLPVWVNNKGIHKKK